MSTWNQKCSVGTSCDEEVASALQKICNGPYPEHIIPDGVDGPTVRSSITAECSVELVIKGAES